VSTPRQIGMAKWSASRFRVNSIWAVRAGAEIPVPSKARPTAWPSQTVKLTCKAWRSAFPWPCAAYSHKMESGGRNVRHLAQDLRNPLRGKRDMKRQSYVLILALCAALFGYGGRGRSNNGSVSGNPTMFSGPWEFALSWNGSGQGSLELNATQLGSNITVNSTFLTNQNNPFFEVNWNGCTDGNGILVGTVMGDSLSLGPAPGDSTSATVSGALALDGKAASGDYQSPENSCIPGAASFTATPIPLLNGTFAGYLTDSHHNKVAFSMSVSSNRNKIQFGGYAVKGTGTAATQGVLQNLSFTGFQVGASVGINNGTTTDINGTRQIVGVARLSPSGASLIVAIAESSQSFVYSGTLNKQR